MVIVVVDDLLFTSKIRAAADKTGATVKVARNSDAALKALHEGGAKLIIIDLDGRSVDSIGAIRAIRAENVPQPRIVGFGAHVNVERLQAARDAGCDEAMPRSAFVTALPVLLAASIGGEQ